MRVLLAPDKFRGTFTAAEVCGHIARGILLAAPETTIVALPLADGGEGTLDALIRALGGTRHSQQVTGPLGDEIVAAYGITPEGVAILESALYCGLDLVPDGRRDPMRTTSYGLGQAIASLLDSGVAEFLIGLGGTATVDGGVGMAKGLGFRFPRSDRVDDSLAHPGLAAARFTVLCDVDNPLLGPGGAARVFGPQKGATPAEVLLLEERLAALAERCASWSGVPADALGCLPMGGAAGGLGLGCRLFLGGRLVPGARFIMERLGFAEKLDSADLLITGEGSFDIQSTGGKAAHIAAESGLAAGKTTAVVTGKWDGTPPGGDSRLSRVFPGQAGPDGKGGLDGDGLAALGAEVMRWAAGIQTPPART